MADRPTRPPDSRRHPPRRTRPAARRAGGGGGVTRTSAPKPRGRFTGRAVVLGVVLLVLALSYIFPLRVYLAQQAEIAELRAHQAEQRAHIAELEEEAALWRDENYIRTQARLRLQYGEPGEVLLIPQWGTQAELAAEQPPAESPDPTDPPASPQPWWDTLWASVQAADQGSAG
ncbi:MAG TPA: septum formation initiator family protein [Natronosporangium sp.]